MLIFLVVLSLYVLAVVSAVVNNRPATTERRWSVGAMIDRGVRTP